MEDSKEYLSLIKVLKDNANKPIPESHWKEAREVMAKSYQESLRIEKLLTPSHDGMNERYGILRR